MSLSRFAICTRIKFNYRIFSKNDSRLYFSSNPANGHENGNGKDEISKSSRYKISSIERDFLDEMKCKLRTLHKLPEITKNKEYNDSKSTKSNTNINTIEKAAGDAHLDSDITSEIDSLAWNEVVGSQSEVDDKKIAEQSFIESVQSCKSNVEPNIIPTQYGQIRKDIPAKESLDQDELAEKKYSGKVFVETEDKIEFSNSIPQNSFKNIKKVINTFVSKPSSQSSFGTSSRSTSLNYVDDQYLNTLDTKSKEMPSGNNKGRVVKLKSSFIEKQYFPSESEKEDLTATNGNAGGKISTNEVFRNRNDHFDSPKSKPNQSSVFQTPPIFKEPANNGSRGDSNVNFFDQSYFSDIKEDSTNHPIEIKKNFNLKTSESSDKNFPEKSQVDESLWPEIEEDFDFTLPESFTRECDNDGTDNTVKVGPATSRQLKRLSGKVVDPEKPKFAYDDPEKPKTAFDTVKEMRKENHKKSVSEDAEKNDKKKITSIPGKWDGNVDSKGFKILTNQVLNTQNMIDVDLISILCNSILFENEQVLVLDKPYGLPSHGGPGVHKSVASLLERMATRREKGSVTYQLVHRLDKETTGVMVLSKTKPANDILRSMFKKRQVTKVYWAITNGVPNPPEGIIDIPMGEGTVGDKYRMELRPIYSSEQKLLKKTVNYKDSKDAITHYKVLVSNGHSALVECRPETGVKHQIRCHLAFGLNTPIIGDHKYSNFTKIAPQKLHPEILRGLGIRQAKVRHVAMHLHARSLVLPEFLADGRNLFSSAKLPIHFVQNLRWLKLYIPSS